jgi:hypothetical protein
VGQLGRLFGHHKRSLKLFIACLGATWCTLVACLAVRARLGVILGASWGCFVAARGHLGRLMGSSGSPIRQLLVDLWGRLWSYMISINQNTLAQ